MQIPGATDRWAARCRLAGSTTRPADLSKRPTAAGDPAERAPDGHRGLHRSPVLLQRTL